MKRLSKVPFLYQSASIFLFSFLFLLLLPPFILSSGMIAMKLVQQFSAPFLLGGIGYLFLLVVFVYFNRPIRQLKGRAFLFFLTLLSLAIKISIVLFLSGEYSQSQDYALMHKFVGLFVSQGLDSKELASFYDWGAFVNRSFPIFWPLRYLFGIDDMLAVQTANCIIETGSLLLVYKLLENIVPEDNRRLAVFLLVLFPVHNWEVLNYTHDIPGTFLFLCCLLLIKTIWKKPLWGKAFFFGMLLGVFVFLLRLQRGLNTFVFLSIFFLVFLRIIQGSLKGWRPARFFLPVCGLIIMPALFYGVPSKLFNEFKAAHKTASLKGGMESFMARGYSMETMGEYNWLYEKIDIATPAEQKKQLQRRIVLSQIKYNPLLVLGVLPVIKSSKFFLVGYASCVEDNLKKTSRTIAADLVEASRTIFTPFLLGLALLGCLHYLRTKERELLLVWLVMLLVAGCVILVMLGEASPRYSYFLHFVLATVAAKGLMSLPLRRESVKRIFCAATGKKIVISSAVFAAAYLVIACSVLGAVNFFAGNTVFQDMRQATVESTLSAHADAIEPQVFPPTLKFFEQHLAIPAGVIVPGDEISGKLALSLAGRPEQAVSFYLYSYVPDSFPSQTFSCSVLLDNEKAVDYRLDRLSYKKRVTRFFRSGITSKHPDNLIPLQVRVRYNGDVPLVLADKIVVVRWGYLSLWPPEKE